MWRAYVYRVSSIESRSKMVGVAGFEPATSSSRTKRASQLRYTPSLQSTEGQQTRPNYCTHKGFFARGGPKRYTLIRGPNAYSLKSLPCCWAIVATSADSVTFGE